MKKSLIPITFWVLVAAFLVVISEFFIPAVSELFRGSFLFLLPFIVFSLLGIALIFLTVKEKVRGTLKKFLLLTGISSAGFFVSVFLHNFFYGLGMVVGHITILRYLMEILHVSFFIIAIFVCPIGFLIGIVGSIVLFAKKRKIR